MRSFAEEVLNRRIVVNEGGRRKKMADGAVLVQNLANQGVKGDLKAIVALARMQATQPTNAQEQQRAASESNLLRPVTEDDWKVLNDFYERYQDELADIAVRPEYGSDGDE